MSSTLPKRILFVCTGNICRSPTAEGVAVNLARRAGQAGEFEFDSAGTHDYHVGEAPDPRTVAAASGRGYDLSALRARRLTSADFAAFDCLLAMDAGHLEIMRHQCPAEHQHKLKLFLDFHPAHHGCDVPDPYYGGPEGFDQVLDLVETAIQSLLRNMV